MTHSIPKTAFAAQLAILAELRVQTELLRQLVLVAPIEEATRGAAAQLLVARFDFLDPLLDNLGNSG